MNNYLEERLNELRTKYRDSGDSKWRYKFEEVQRMLEHLHVKRTSTPTTQRGEGRDTPPPSASHTSVDSNRGLDITPDKRQQALDKMAENARELGLDYEPVAKVVPCHTPSGKRVALNTEHQQLPIGTDLYTRPQPAAQWVGLTDEEVVNLVDDEDWYNDPEGFVKIVEAKLKEKNNG